MRVRKSIDIDPDCAVPYAGIISGKETLIG